MGLLFLPGADAAMTISTRLLGYSLSISFGKTIRVPIDRVNHGFGIQNQDEPDAVRLASQQPLLISQHSKETLGEPLVQKIWF